MEGKALRLRLSVQEVQAAECQQRMMNMQNEQQRNEAFSLGTACCLYHGSPLTGLTLSTLSLTATLNYLHSSFLLYSPGSEGLAVGAGVETEDMAYVPSANSGTGRFYNTQSFDHEGAFLHDIFTLILIISILNTK